MGEPEDMTKYIKNIVSPIWETGIVAHATTAREDCKTYRRIENVSAMRIGKLLVFINFCALRHVINV